VESRRGRRLLRRRGRVKEDKGGFNSRWVADGPVAQEGAWFDSTDRTRVRVSPLAPAIVGHFKGNKMSLIRYILVAALLGVVYLMNSVGIWSRILCLLRGEVCK
jgi:hypothetical protein